ncbi:MAG: hypothetical protein ACR2OZ_07190 [Verrucomicrobiales bacterium]
MVFPFLAFYCRSFVFVCGTSVLPWLLDLIILKWLGRTVIHVYLGSDSRPVYLNGKSVLDLCDTHGVLDVRGARKMLADQIRRLNTIYKNSLLVVDNPLSGLLHSGPYVNWFAMGIPTRVVTHQKPMKINPGEPIRILHAPSAPEIKGTDRIRQVIADLKAEGWLIEYQELCGVSNDTVLRRIECCHLVIDEMFSDVALAGLGAEAAARGRAVVVGGYGWEAVRKFGDSFPIAPSIRIHPDNLRNELRILLANPQLILENGAALFRYVNSCWTAQAVAERYLLLLCGQFSDAWWVEGPKLDYVGGMGASQTVIETAIRAIVEDGGLSALGLDGKDGLRNAALRVCTMACHG